MLALFDTNSASFLNSMRSRNTPQFRVALARLPNKALSSTASIPFPSLPLPTSFTLGSSGLLFENVLSVFRQSSSQLGLLNLYSSSWRASELRAGVGVATCTARSGAAFLLVFGETLLVPGFLAHAHQSLPQRPHPAHLKRGISSASERRDGSACGLRAVVLPNN